MYRLLIADDEALEREGLQFIIERMMPGEFQIMHAENGRLAIQRAEQFRPHIVMMDIKMPGIEGLEALRQMKERQPELKMVLVTAYDYFSYAQQAVSLGVKEYLLKPAKRDQVVALLRRLVEELEREGRQRDEGCCERRSWRSCGRWRRASWRFCSCRRRARHGDGTDRRAARAGRWRGRGDRLSRCGRGRRQRFAYALRRYYEARARCIVSPVIGRHAAVFVLGGETGNGAVGNSGGGHAAGAERDAWGAAAAAGLLQPQELAQRAQAFLAEQLGVAVRAAAGPAGRGLAGLRRSYRAAAGQLGVSLGAAGETEPPPEWLAAEARSGGDGGEPPQALGAIERARAWIAERYREELSMEQAAEHVNLSPFYFSKLFKQHVGETFIDYVTRLRIDRAKELIAGAGELSLKEVCYEVGYNDPNYFSRVFKKVTSLSPTEYRALQQRQM